MRVMSLVDSFQWREPFLPLPLRLGLVILLLQLVLTLQLSCCKAGNREEMCFFVDSEVFLSVKVDG